MSMVAPSPTPTPSSLPFVFKLVYLNELTGETGRLPDGALVNIGGVSGSSFTIGGKPVVLADGTTSDGSQAGLSVSLQNAYDSSTGSINLSAGKDFVITALDHDIFKVDAATGDVTISGNLTVLGASTAIESQLAAFEEVTISPTSRATTALRIEPAAGVAPIGNLVDIKVVNAGPSVFTIDATGVTTLRALQTATINGIDLTQFYADFEAHINGVGTKHSAAEISVQGPLTNVSGSNVQQVVESIDAKLSAVQAGESNIRTYEYVQGSESQFWYINHNQNSMRATVTIYDMDYVQTWPDEVRVIDSNTIRVTFSSAQAGRAMVLLF